MCRARIPLVAAIASIVALQSCASLPRINDKRPNFLIIVSDDQRSDAMGYMPVTKSVIFDQGVSFTHAYITTPLCCPSRASILTGMYAHNTGVHTNDDPLTKKTLMYDLHQNGYYTGLVGKYLNSWKGELRPEFDYWVSFFKGETVYYDPYLNVNGSWSTSKGYITDLLADHVIEFLNQAAREPRPFGLIFAPNAPHQPSTPFEGDLSKLTDLTPFRPPSFNEADISDKPLWVQDNVLDDATIKHIDNSRRKQLLTLIALDRSNAKIFDVMRQNGQLDNTVIIYLSDNGLLWGEHRISSKNSFYEEASKVPFALRYPPIIPKPYVEDRLVANIDIAPTVYELAGLPIPASVDGSSLVGLFNGSPWRDSLLIEGWPPRGYFSSIHTDRYVYSETVDDRPEFYDLQLDPYELQSQVDNPEYEEVIAALKHKLQPLQQARGGP